MSDKRLVAAIEQYVETRAMFEAAKAVLDSAMSEEGESKVGYGRYTAYRTEEKRRTVNPTKLLGMGVEPWKVAEAAGSVSRTKLIANGVDPETIADCTTETSFVKCYVKEDTAK